MLYFGLGSTWKCWKNIKFFLPQMLDTGHQVTALEFYSLCICRFWGRQTTFQIFWRAHQSCRWKNHFKYWALFSPGPTSARGCKAKLFSKRISYCVTVPCLGKNLTKDITVFHNKETLGLLSNPVHFSCSDFSFSLVGVSKSSVSNRDANMTKWICRKVPERNDINACERGLSA